MDHRAAWMITAAALGVGCEVGPVSRHVQLAAEDGWPQARTWFVGEALGVEVLRTEPLRASSVMRAWINTHGGATVPAGVVPPGEPTFLDGPALGVAWPQVHEVVITEEDASAPATVPSTSVLFRGAAGHELTAVEGSTAGVAATAHLEDGTLTLAAPVLPLMGTRMFYGVWLLGPVAGAADGGDAPRLVGRLYGRGTYRFDHLGMPALYRQVVVTVECEEGPGTPSLASVVLRGTIPTSDVPPGATAPATTPPAGHAH